MRSGGKLTPLHWKIGSYRSGGKIMIGDCRKHAHKPEKGFRWRLLRCDFGMCCNLRGCGSADLDIARVLATDIARVLATDIAMVLATDIARGISRGC